MDWVLYIILSVIYLTMGILSGYTLYRYVNETYDTCLIVDAEEYGVLGLIMYTLTWPISVPMSIVFIYVKSKIDGYFQLRRKHDK